MNTMIRRHSTLLAISTVSLLSLGLLTLSNSQVLAQETPIYKSIAADGSTVFTDQPAPDATVIKPSALNMMDSSATKPAAASVPVPESQPLSTIDSVVIEHPGEQQTFNDPEGSIWVEFNTSPTDSIPTDITANVRVNGVLVVTGNRHRMPIDVPVRGAHQIQVQLVDQSGSIVAESEPVEIFVKRRVAGSAN